jgi:hypothetical protein
VAKYDNLTGLIPHWPAFQEMCASIQPGLELRGWRGEKATCQYTTVGASYQLGWDAEKDIQTAIHSCGSIICRMSFYSEQRRDIRDPRILQIVAMFESI